MSWSTLYILGVIQALFLAFLLFVSRRERWGGNVYLSCLLLIIASLLALFALRIELGNNIFPWLFWTVVATPVLMGPCLLFYLRSLQSSFRFARWSNALHGIPFLLLIGLFLPEILSSPAAGLTHLDGDDTRDKIRLAAYFKSAVIDGYLIYCLFLLRPSLALTGLRVEATRFLRIMLGLFLAVSLFGSLLSTLFWQGVFILPAADYLELGFLTLISYLLAFYVFYFNVAPIHPREKYANPVLLVSTRQQLADHLREHLSDRCLLSHPDYSASFVASKLAISEQQLSEVIALEFDCNFNTLSNRSRFEYFTELLDSRPADTLMELAFAAGFKSKSSFNRAVRALSGLSPSEYRKQHARNAS